jgi:hypothetical protein
VPSLPLIGGTEASFGYSVALNRWAIKLRSDSGVDGG